MTEQQYLKERRELGRIFDSGVDDEERFNMLVDRVEAYEAEHYQIGAGGPDNEMDS